MAESSIDLFHLLLFVIPGFVFVWQYRRLTKSEYPGDFEYFGKSIFFGLVIMVIVQLLEKIFGSFDKFLNLLNNPYAASLILSIVSFSFAVLAYQIRELYNTHKANKDKNRKNQKNIKSINK